MEGIQELTSGRTSQSNDVCHYTLYFPAPEASTSRSTSIESTQATAAAILEYAQELCDSVQPDDGYIWQRESFNLRPSSEQLPAAAESGALCLQGSTTVGESVEDEWWIVWLLREISKKWTDAVIEIHDNDGQFLLIEAAEVLPGWLNPDNAGNRLWISSGILHLIPLSTASHEEGGLRLATALSIMFDSTKRSAIIASPDISDAIWTRAQKTYNSVKQEHSHRTIAYLPDEIIRILQSDPPLITKAVTTFYERDAIQLKACQYMRRFRPSPAHYATVRMSRSLYAQLASQRFYAPKPFERAGWLSISANDDLKSSQSVENRRREIGMKIACGFEMLYQEEKSSLGRQGPTNGTKLEFDRNGKNNLSPSTATAGPRHLSQNQAYLRYMVALTESGYFQGETAGSSLYNRLEARAKAYWLDMQEDKAHKGGNLAERMDEIAEGAEKQALPQPQTLQEDPDDWLYIDESRLEDMLQGKPDKAPEGSADAAETMTQEEQEEEIAKEQAQRLQGMADKFSSFLEGQGALEGAMFEDEKWSDDESEDSDQSDGDDMVAGPSTSTKDKEARLAKLVPGLTDSEWGSAAANEARLVAKRQEDAKKASEDLKSDQAEALRADTKTKGPTKADMQAAGLSAKEKFDGDDSDDELYEEELVGEQEESAAKPKLLQETSMQELSDEEDAELEFGDGEREDFLKFAREALGLTEEQYADILRSREKRGAYIPSTTKTDDDGLELPHKKRSQTQSEIASSTSRAEQNAPSSASISSQTQQQPNSRLDSFEALMEAMDTELSKARQASQRKASERPAAGQTGTGEDDDNISEDDEDFDFADLDAELAAALKRDESDSAPADYTLIKNFLESFKSQNGLAGPVSNMFGRLDQDFSMPRDK